MKKLKKLIKKTEKIKPENPEKTPEIETKQPPAEADTGGFLPNINFEEALKAKQEAEKTDSRGGARPGAGRKPGLTDEKIQVRRLPQIANESLVSGLQFIFGLWEAKAKIPGIHLDRAEAENLALPLTQLQEYYFPGAVPEIAYVWSNAICLTFLTVAGRLEIIRAYKAGIKPTEQTEPEPGVAA